MKAHTYDILGDVYTRQDKIDQAIIMHKFALEALLELKTEAGAANQLLKLSDLYNINDRAGESEDALLSAINIYTKLGHNNAVAHAQGKLGYVYINKGDIDTGCKSLKMAYDELSKLSENEFAKNVEENYDKVCAIDTTTPQ